jgi:WD40 repeat protein
MSSLFLSYSSRDRVVAEHTRQELLAAGYYAVFLDVAPAEGIAVGQSWEAELYSQLRRADGVVFLASAASVESKWCFAELCLARSLGRPIFPVRIEPTARLELLDDVQWVDLRPGVRTYAPLLDGLRRAGLRPDDSFAWDPARSPYPGLEPFDQADAAVFFGREAEACRLLQMVTPTLLHGPGRVVAVVGASGSGKSSLVRAGLLPRLGRLARHWLVLPPMHPGTRPLRNLARSLAAARGADRADQTDVEQLLRRLDAAPGSLTDLAMELAEGPDGLDRRVLLVIDQAEELVTRSGRAEQERFLTALTSLRRADSPLWAVATLRAEFLSNAPDRAGLAALIEEVLAIEPVKRDRLSEVILRPARRAGIEFEPGLVERMVQETIGGDALPLLAWTLQQLYQGVAGRPGRLVTVADYERLGGVIGALRQQADRLRDELVRLGLGDFVEPTLLRLVSVDAEGEPARRRLARNRLSDAEAAVVHAFVDARLLTSRTDGPDDGVSIVEVAHEALLRQWPPLRDAIAAAQDGLRLRSEAERLARDWDRGRNDESYLLRGGRLAAFAAWAELNPEDLEPVARRFLDASVDLAEHERAAAAERERVRALLQAESWARAALFEVYRRPTEAVLLAIAALSTIAGEPPPAVLSPLYEVLDGVRLRHVLRGHGDRLSSVVFSPDGQLLLTGSYDNTALLWSLGAAEPRLRLEGHEQHVVCVAWHPDGTRVATGSWDGTARIWDPHTGTCLNVLTGHEGWVSAINWSPDGSRLATGSMDHTAGIWDAATGELIRRLAGHTDWVRSAEWRPDGRQLLTGSYDGTAALWDTATGKRIRQFVGHTAAVPAVRWLPDGEGMLTASEDGTLRVWRVADEEALQTMEVHTSPTFALDLDPAGRRVVTGGEDGTVRIFDIATAAIEAELPGHTSWVSAVRWSPDGRWLASSSGDSTARLTYLPDRRGTLVDRTDGWVSSIRWHPDGTRAARAAGDGTILIWAIDQDRDGTGEILPEMNALCLDWHPGGTLLATGGFSGPIRVIDTDRHEFVGEFPEHADRVTALAWHPAGNSFATASSDGTALVVDAETGTTNATLTSQALESLAWSRDGTYLALGGWDNAVHVWHLQTDSILDLDGHTAALHAVAWGPGGLLASTSGDGTARVWDVRKGIELRQLPAGEAFTVGWSPDGRFLATGSRDGVVRIWAAGSADKIQELRHPEAIHALDWSPDSERILCGGESGSTWLWSVGTEHLRQELRELASNVLTDDEIRRLVPAWPNI